ncbi:MAG: LamG domain-containing protein [Deltaproteobacteria bacterium]|nr:LamG domain-containing protein [Deltaproteobacteria bacterium]
MNKKSGKIITAGKLLFMLSMAAGLMMFAGCDHASLSDPYSDAKAVWHMDERDGDLIRDVKGLYNATAYHTKIVANHPPGYARYLNGLNAYIQTPLKLSKDMTVSLWVKPERDLWESAALTKKRSGHAIMLDNGHTERTNFVLQSSDLEYTKFVWHTADTDVFFELPWNEWSHLVVVANSQDSTLQVFLNGELLGENRTKGEIVIDDTPLTIGKWAVKDKRFFRGMIDEVVIWDRALTKSEIKKVFEVFITSAKN